MKRVNELLLNISGLFMLIMVLLGVIQVLSRYILKIALPWNEELIRYMMIYLVFLASSVAVYKRVHLSVEIFDIILKPKPFLILDRVRLVSILIFSLFYSYIALNFIIDQININQVSPAMQISMGWPLSALLFSGLLTMVNSASLLLTKE